MPVLLALLQVGDTPLRELHSAEPPVYEAAGGDEAPAGTVQHYGRAGFGCRTRTFTSLIKVPLPIILADSFLNKVLDAGA